MSAYKNVNTQIEQISEWFSYALLGTLVLIVLFPISYTGVCYFILDLGVESFYLYPPTEWVRIKFSCILSNYCVYTKTVFFNGKRWPFDWKAPIGYLVAWSCGFVGIAPIAFAFAPFFTYLLGSCCLFYSIADDITKDLAAFNIDLSLIKVAKKTSIAANRAELRNKFRAIVQIYADAKQ